MNRYQDMALWGHPMLAPPLEVKADRDGWSNIQTQNLLLAMPMSEVPSGNRLLRRHRHSLA